MVTRGRTNKKAAGFEIHPRPLLSYIWVDDIIGRTNLLVWCYATPTSYR